MLAERTVSTDPREFFQEHLLPIILPYARRCFAFIRCSATRDDAISEVLTFAWFAYSQMCQRGEQDRARPHALARFSVLKAKAGRNLPGERPAGGSAPDHDAMSRKAQTRYGFRAFGFCPDEDPEWLSQFATADTPIPEQVALKVDLESWFGGRTQTEKRILRSLMAGSSRIEAAKEARVTPTWIDVLRRRWRPTFEQLAGE